MIPELDDVKTTQGIVKTIQLPHSLSKVCNATSALSVRYEIESAAKETELFQLCNL